MGKKNKVIGMKTVDDFCMTKATKAYIQEFFGHIKDDDDVSMTGRDFKDELANTFGWGINVGEGEIFPVAVTKPKPYEKVILINRKGESVVGYYDEKNDGLRIYGYEMYGYITSKDFGLITQWRVL